MDYLTLIQDLPTPSKTQCHQFIRWITNSHSWYKHLPLVEGGEFIIFLDPYVAEGFNENNKRLHYGWKTRDEYISKYGYLNFTWKIPSMNQYNIETREELRIDLPTLISNNIFKLFPYISPKIEEAYYTRHENDFKFIRKTPSSSVNGELLISWEDSFLKREAIQQIMDELDYELYRTEMKNLQIYDYYINLPEEKMDVISTVKNEKVRNAINELKISYNIINILYNQALVEIEKRLSNYFNLIGRTNNPPLVLG